LALVSVCSALARHFYQFGPELDFISGPFEVTNQCFIGVPVKSLCQQHSDIMGGWTGILVLAAFLVKQAAHSTENQLVHALCVNLDECTLCILHFRFENIRTGNQFVNAGDADFTLTACKS
jgi:hypothetical protein